LRKYILTIIFLLLAANLYADEIVVIVNEQGPLIQISEAEIREIYIGNIKFMGRAAVTPIHYSEGHVKDAFLASIVKMNSREYRLYWTKKVFQEGGSVPSTLSSFPSILSFVKNTPGAIGYAPASELTGIKGIKAIVTIRLPISP
jgi:ABC-type phosphate transport system substrate-binding protein